MQNVVQNGDPSCMLRVASIKQFALILQTAKAGSKQVCSVFLSNDGLSLYWEDDSKAMQCAVHMKQEMFSDIKCPAERCDLGLPLNVLYDVLNVFASTPHGGLELNYPGSRGELLCVMQEACAEGVQCCTYASLDTQEQPSFDSFVDTWQNPASGFILPGYLMKEAIDDLEWPGASIKIALQHHPPKVVFSANGNGAVEIEIAAEHLTDFMFEAGSAAGGPHGGEYVQHCYKYKHLHSACSFLPSQRDLPIDVSTRVSVDQRGLLKVTHMFQVEGATHLHHHHHHSADPSPSRPTQRLFGSRQAVVQFVILPVLEDAD